MEQNKNNNKWGYKANKMNKKLKFISNLVLKFRQGFHIFFYFKIKKMENNIKNLFYVDETGRLEQEQQGV